MEKTKSNAIVPINDLRHLHGDDDNKVVIKDHHQAFSPKLQKKRGGMHLLRVALYMLRSKTGKSKTAPMSIDLASMVLGSVRPLHLHASNDNGDSNYQRKIPSAKETETHVTAMLEETVKITEEVFTPPMSPAAPKSIASSSSMESLSSMYASATNLNELDVSEEDDEECDDASGGDEMIDAKAEEFIHQFYERMRIQNYEYKNIQKQRKMKRAEM